MKKVLYPLLMSLMLLFLVGCTNEKDLTADLQDRAEDTGFDFRSNDGHQLLFLSEGMTADYLQENPGTVDLTVFPFEVDKTYPDYTITQKGDIITIKTGDGLEFELTVIGDRLYRDEKNDRDYITNFYLFDEKESQE